MTLLPGQLEARMAAQARRAIRTAAQRATGLAALPLTDANRAFFQEAARIEDARNLRERFEAKLLVYPCGCDRLGNKVINYARLEYNACAHRRIARVCDWAKRRMKRADDALTQGE